MVICCKVRLEDIVKVRDGIPGKEEFSLRNRIKSRHLDFVLCDQATMTILLCIELDDRTHRQAERKERDAFVDTLLEGVGIPLMRHPVQHEYPLDQLQARILEAAADGGLESVSVGADV